MYVRARISATSAAEANRISQMLVAKKLVAGTMVYSGNCHYWWKGKIVQRKYWNIGAFTLAKHKKAIIAFVRTLHGDQVPIIAFNTIDGNKDFLHWIDESVS